MENILTLTVYDFNQVAFGAGFGVKGEKKFAKPFLSDLPVQNSHNRRLWSSKVVDRPVSRNPFDLSKFANPN